MNSFTLFVVEDSLLLVITICVVLFTVIFAIAGVNMIKLLREIRKMARNVRMFQKFISSLISKI